MEQFIEIAPLEPDQSAVAGYCSNRGNRPGGGTLAKPDKTDVPERAVNENRTGDARKTARNTSPVGRGPLAGQRQLAIQALTDSGIKCWTLAYPARCSTFLGVHVDETFTQPHDVHPKHCGIL